MMGSNQPIFPWSNIYKDNINEVIASGNEFNPHISGTSIYL